MTKLKKLEIFTSRLDFVILAYTLMDLKKDFNRLR